MNKLCKIICFYVLIVMCFICCSCGSVSVRNSGGLYSRGEYQLLRGMNLYQKGEKLEALASYEKAYEKLPRDKNVLTELGLLHNELGNNEKSLYYMEKAYKADKADLSVIRNLCSLYYLNGEYNKAESLLAKVDIMDNDMMKIKGYILAKKGNAREAYNWLIRVEDRYYDSLYYEELISVYNRLGKNKHGKSQNELYSRLMANYEDYKDNREYILQLARFENTYLGSASTASTKIIQYILAHGGDDDIYLSLAESYIAIGDKASAHNAFEFVSESGKNTPRFNEIIKKLI